jgi:hypothetical protein
MKRPLKSRAIKKLSLEKESLKDLAKDELSEAHLQQAAGGTGACVIVSVNPYAQYPYARGASLSVGSNPGGRQSVSGA